jgi:uncharacterized protein (DUF488 family)
MKLYTLGHSAHRLEKFLALLDQHGIRILVDVRSVPASRFHPQYNRATLERSLTEHGVRYVFAGQALGGRPMDPSVYPGGRLPVKGQANPPRPDYAEMMKRDWFVQGIEHLLTLAADADAKRPTAILCSEEDPAHCHREHLIAAYLRANHPEIEILHIRGNGTLTSPESRLL